MKGPNYLFGQQVIQLLKRCHEPLVEVRESSIPNAGLGVFLRDNVRGSGMIKTDQVLCLYPGIYTPPMPNQVKFDDQSVYLANQLNDLESNGYILNLNDNPNIGGYIDGEPNRKEENSSPSAVGHLINYNGSDNANVRVVSFCWSSILSYNGNAQTRAFDMTSLSTDEFYNIPNTLRSDGTPWYFDGITNKLVYFPLLKHNNSSNSNISPLRGAAICLKSSINHPDRRELFLDYALRNPLPKWAQGWYDP